MYSAFHGWNCSVSYLSFVYGRSLWAELNGRENSLHWKVNMLLLFSIMTLCLSHPNVAIEAVRRLEHNLLHAENSQSVPRCRMRSMLSFFAATTDGDLP